MSLGPLATGRAIRSRVEIVARRSADGSTVLSRLHAEGQLAVRRTAPQVVHLVSVAAGPIGGDSVELVIRVGAGARLEVRSAAAALVLPGRHDPLSRTLTDAEVGPDGWLELGLEPAVIAHRARHEATTRVRLAAGAGLWLTERLVLGRHGEPPGTWSGRTVIDRDGRPLLRHTVRSATLLAEGARGYRSEVRTDQDGPAATGPGCVVLPLAGGGTLRTAWAADLSQLGVQPSSQVRPSALPNSV